MADKLSVVPPSHYFSSQTLPLDAHALKSSPVLDIHARSLALKFSTGSGVFSKKALDEGSRLLIETLDLSPDGHFCDLGCGWGAVGSFIAADFPEAKVFACDVNARAAQLARFNFQRNGLKNTLVWCGDGLGAARSGAFDVVACNPPIRAGNAVIAKLFDDAHRGLKPRGALWVVIRTAQGAKSWQKRLAEQFGACETLRIDSGYRILRAEKSA